MIVSQIVACSTAGIIGLDGKMPWHISGDLRYFKKLTSGHAVIMGRKTFDSIGRPLPKRLNVVISRQTNLHIEGAELVHSLSGALELCQTQSSSWGEEVFIIGGGEIYRQSLPLTQRVYLTRVEAEIAGDTSYPQLEEHGLHKVSEQPTIIEDSLRYRFEIWERAACE